MSNQLDEKTQRRVMVEIDLGQTPHGPSVYGSRAWRINYRNLCKLRDYDTLRYIAEDCRQAVEAQPDGLKYWQYSNEQRYCEHELYRRDRDREREKLCAAVVERINSDMSQRTLTHIEAERKARIKKLVARVSIRDLKNYLGEE